MRWQLGWAVRMAVMQEDIRKKGIGQRVGVENSLDHH